MLKAIFISIMAFLPCLVYMLIGGWFIKNAMDYYINRRYFWFGVMVMGVVFEAAFIFRVVFKY